MKQIINKWSDGSIYRKYYINHLNKKNGMEIYYHTNSNIRYKTNYLNGKLFGLNINHNNNNNNKPTGIIYNL